MLDRSDACFSVFSCDAVAFPGAKCLILSSGRLSSGRLLKKLISAAVRFRSGLPGISLCLRFSDPRAADFFNGLLEPSAFG